MLNGVQIGIWNMAVEAEFALKATRQPGVKDLIRGHRGS